MLVNIWIKLQIQEVVKMKNKKFEWRKEKWRYFIKIDREGNGLEVD